MTNQSISNQPSISRYRLDTSGPLYGSSSVPIDSPVSNFVTIEPVSDTVSIDPVDNTGPTPLGQVGINSPNPRVKLKPRSPNNISTSNKDSIQVGSNEEKCVFPSSVSVAVVILVVVIAILIIYMYIQPVERSLAFGNNLVLKEIELNDDRLQRLNIGLIITLTLFSLTLFTTGLNIEEPTKLGGRRGSFMPNRPPNIINSIQSDIYIIILNLLLFMMAIAAIVYNNSAFFTLVFSLVAVSLLLFWRSNAMFLLLAVFEVSILVVFGLKFLV